ncbi:uncharacterized protein LOC111619588 [Centruroides sculpturatus]|uniref:uncharacterized protein LOC111619588 n=1 Tax=Centruroides sculpturatus TaxID=218467 RepID=UPI000C6DEBB0|nr:uncharacterized protein LOC111619588 [Centruroides sculpturatus]
MACVENNTEDFEILNVEDSNENYDEVEAEDSIEDFVKVERKECSENNEILKVEDTREIREKSDSVKDYEKAEVENTIKACEYSKKSEMECSIEDYEQSEVKNRRECEKLEVEDFMEDYKQLEVIDRKEEVEDFMEDYKQLEVIDRKDYEKSDLEESKKFYEKLKDNILIMNNIEDALLKLFVWMEKEFKHLTENKYTVLDCNILNALLGQFVKEYEDFKLIHESFVDNFVEMNKYSIYEKKELFVFNFSSAIDNFISFNSIDQSMHQFKHALQFPYEYAEFTICFWNFIDYFFRIKQCCLPFKEHFNEEKNLKIALWNCCGLKDKEIEFVRYMNQEDLDIFLLQGTHFNKFDYPGYFVFRNPGENVMALLSKNVCRNAEELECPNSFRDKITNYQILKLQLKEYELTIANIYNPYSLNENFDITRLPPILSKNCIVLGDFSAFSKNWGDCFTNSIGENVEKFLRISDFQLLNKFIPTSDEKFGNRIMDLALCSDFLLPHITWEVNESNFANGRRIIRMDIDLES